MDDATSRVRRRLRQRTSLERVVEASEVITLDSSSDEFVLENKNQNDQEKHTKTSRSKRSLKRLRRGDADKSDGESPTAATSQATEWACTRCTYMNEPQRLVCEICLSARAMPRPTRKLSAWLTSSNPTQETTKRKASMPVETIDSSDDGESSEFAFTRHRKLLQENGMLWSETTHTQQLDELCVQKKKIQEVQEWLQQSIPCRLPQQHDPTKRLLFLCGPPGSGKSTTVRFLAKTMGVTIKEWHDNSSAGKLQYHRYMKDEFHVAQVSTWDDFIDFIDRSVNYSALQVAALPDKRSRKRPLTQTPSNQATSSAQGQLIMLENWPQNPLGSSQDSTVWDEKLISAFRQVVNPAANLQYPVVCIFSDVRDKKMDAMHLARVFSEDVVRSPFTSIINFNPVTAAQMKKALARTLEKLDYSISSQDLMKIVDLSDGDIRHAMNMAQLYHKKHTATSTKRTNTKSKKSSIASVDAWRIEDTESEDIGRDSFFSDFHVVGKLLHSKNIKQDANEVTPTENKLDEFDRILDSSAMSLDRVLSLLHSNCPGFFTEIDDLDDALGLMSQSETWLHGAYRTTSSSAAFKLSHNVVRSIVVRTIALTNKHPAPSAFRPITAPRTFETTRRMVSSREQSLSQQQAMTGGSSSSHPYLCRGDVYAFEIQPFVDIMSARRNFSSNTPGGTIPRINGEASRSHQLVDDEIEDSDDAGW